MSTLTDKIFFVSFVSHRRYCWDKGWHIFRTQLTAESSEAAGNFQKRAPLILPGAAPKGHCFSGLLQHYVFLDAETEAQKGRTTSPRPDNYLDRKALQDFENPPIKKKSHT